MKTDVFKAGGAVLCLGTLLISVIIAYMKQRGAIFLGEPVLVEIMVGFMLVFVFTVGYVLFIIGAAFDKE